MQLLRKSECKPGPNTNTDRINTEKRINTVFYNNAFQKYPKTSILKTNYTLPCIAAINRKMHKRFISNNRHPSNLDRIRKLFDSKYGTKTKIAKPVKSLFPIIKPEPKPKPKSKSKSKSKSESKSDKKNKHK